VWARPWLTEERLEVGLAGLGVKYRSGHGVFPAVIDAQADDWCVDTAGVDLLPAERILWQGHSLQHRLLRRADAVLVPFSILWCGFAVFWEVSVLRHAAAPVLLQLFGIPFVLVGLYVVFGRFVVRAIITRRTRYVLTDRRVVVVGGLSGARTTSAYLNSLPPPVCTEGADGSGSLAFGEFPGIGEIFNSRNGWRAWASEPSATPVLRDIPEVRRVRDLVANSQANDPRR
jgi:hypothetical protein